MTELDKLKDTLVVVEAAIDAIKHAAIVERRLSHAKHTDERFTKALCEMDGIASGIQAKMKRIQAIGR